MPRSQYQSTSIPVDELEKWRRLCADDPRLPDPATPIDIIRCLYRRASAKNELQSVHNSVHSGSDNEQSLSQRNLHTPKESEQRTEKLRMESLVLAQKITLEDRKRKTAYWQAVRSGKAQAPTRDSPSSSPTVESQPYVCKVHQTIHSRGKCWEVIKAESELVDLKTW